MDRTYTKTLYIVYAKYSDVAPATILRQGLKIERDIAA